MNYKQEAAREAVTFIADGSAVGLGMGATMAYMVEFLLEQKKTNIQLFTSAAATKSLLEQHGFAVHDISAVSSLHIYFDGCDQFDKNLNALKSGGGIHTTEKLFASMAEEFVLVGDESKYVDQLETRFPIVLEILPQAVCFVTAKLSRLFTGITTSVRRDSETGQPSVTQYGNYLLDLWFSRLPEISSINPSVKKITGVVETSLFYNMADKAIVAGDNGVRVLTKNQ